MIVLLLLGFCAGVLNVLRSAGVWRSPTSGRVSRARQRGRRRLIRRREEQDFRSRAGKTKEKRGVKRSDHQFLVNKIGPDRDWRIDFSFTNASLFMVATVGAAAGFLYLTTSQRGLIPTRMQSVSEMSYEFIASMLREGAGSHGMKFFPMVLLAVHVHSDGELLGMGSPISSPSQPDHRHLRACGFRDRHRPLYGFYKHGFGFLKLFVPQGVPGALLPLVVSIEIHLVPFPSDQPLGPSFRQHAGGPHHAEGLRRLRRIAQRFWGARHRRRDPAAHHDRRPYRS